MRWQALPREDLEQQLNPRATVPDFQKHLDRNRALADQARARLPLNKDVRYGPGPRQILDALPARRPGSPLLLYFHGGYWRALSKDSVTGVAATMHDQGYACVLPSYDLCPTVSLDDIVRQARDALRWSVQNAESLNARRDLVVVSGTSAGAHLAMMLLLAEEAGPGNPEPSQIRPAGAALFSGIFDLAPVRQLTVNADLRLTAAAARRNSPTTRRQGFLDVPVAIFAGALESALWIDQSRRLASRIIERGMSAVSFDILPDTHHFNIGVGDPAAWGGKRLTAFMKRFAPAPG